MANDLIAGSVGFRLILDPRVGGSNIATLTGATATLTVIRPDGSRSSYGAAIAGNGKTATYTTVGSDFPVDGKYTLQFVVTSGGVTLYSVAQDLIVLPRL